MAESPEELGKEIDRLWAKVAASSVDAPEPVMPPATSSPVGQEVAWEAVSLLKRQQRHESRYWTEVLEAKERALAALRERQASMERELHGLRQKVQADEARIVGEGLDAKARLDAAAAALEEERARHDEEHKRLGALLEQTRERWRAEAEAWRLERLEFDKREQRHLADLQQVQEVSARYQGEAAKTGKMEGSLKEAKNALEKTLAELVRERQIREGAEKERERALQKVDEIQKHLDELSKLWEEERGQWRELWDRERSTWETQRQEFSAWEENLRKEREAWQSEMSSKEKAQLEHADQLTAMLRQSAETSTQLAEATRLAEFDRRKERAAAVTKAANVFRYVAIAALVVALMTPVARYATRYHFTPLSSAALERTDVTGLAFDGSLVWVSGWDGNLEGLDPRDFRTVRKASPHIPPPYRPTALAFGGSFLWTLDAAQGRVVRHQASDPNEVVAWRPSPGPAPSAMAYDGQSLWSYDAANKAIYRHADDEASYKSFPLGVDAVVTSMAWIGGELWAYDATSRDLLVLSFKDDHFSLRGRYALGEPIIGMIGVKVNVKGKTRRELWVLAGPRAQRTGFALIRYSY